MWRATSQPHLHMNVVSATSMNPTFPSNINHGVLNGKPRPFSAAVRRQPRQLSGFEAKPLTRPKSAAMLEGKPLTNYGQKNINIGSMVGNQNLNANTSVTSLRDMRLNGKNDNNNTKGSAGRQKPGATNGLFQAQGGSVSSGQRRPNPHFKVNPSPNLRGGVNRVTKLGDKYRSTALELQVKLAEKVRHLQERAYPHAVGPNDMLSTYSDMFDEVLGYDKAFAPILEVIKEGYHRILANSTDYQAAKVRRHCVRAIKTTVQIPRLDMTQVSPDFRDYDDDYEEEDEDEEEYEEEFDDGEYSDINMLQDSEAETYTYEEEGSYRDYER